MSCNASTTVSSQNQNQSLVIIASQDTISSQTSHPTGDLHSQWLTFMASTILLLHPSPLCLRLTGSRFFSPRPTGTYLTHEAKGSDDAPDADTAIINAEGGHSGAEEKKEYFI
uniref:Neurexin/syndecan/glycophorin C domain-containing protein n=1 Tax=Poecilia mexicana TaxID=48701 RepID=A0A3B3WUD9_9TELE